MRTIHKLSEPRRLRELRAKPGAVFDERGLDSAPVVQNGNPMLSGDEKQELREQLCREQHGLCCYCSNGINPTEDGMRIEHWKPLSRFPAHQLEYWNLMAACPGGKGLPERLHHCDLSKADLDLCRNPSERADRVDEIVHFANGDVRSSDPAFDAELGENPERVRVNSKRVLNLNIPFLRNNRIGALDGFQQGLDKRGTLDRDAWARLLRKWNGEEGGTLEPFSPVVVWWIKKKLSHT
jgi:uncharacterized protein (TIGR02646 family)